MTGRSYLDYNATAPVRPEAARAMAAAMAAPGNPSSVHADGRAARRIIEDARRAIAALAGAAPNQVVLTGGGSEANNQVLRTGAFARVLVSAIEHESVRLSRPDAVRIPVGADGMVDLEALSRALEAGPAPALVSLMLANNETGVIQPVAEAARIAHAHEALLHCDAVQAGGKIGFEFAALGADYLTLSAHKLGGPQGIGALILREGVPLDPLIRGGGQERGRRAGTEAVPCIAGFGAAADAARAGLADFAASATLRDAFETGLRTIAPEAVIFGAESPRLPNTTNFAVPGLGSETQVMALDLAGISVSAGAACSSGKVGAPEVLLAMGVPEALGRCALRVSFGWTSGADDVARLLTAWEQLYQRAGDAAAKLPGGRVAAGV